MRTPDEIHSMIDYLEQKDPKHPDIAVLRWALKEDQRPVDRAHSEELNQCYAAIAKQNEVIQEQSLKILDQQEKLRRFVRG